jgi:hypothetical protein
LSRRELLHQNTLVSLAAYPHRGTTLELWYLRKGFFVDKGEENK